MAKRGVKKGEKGGIPVVPSKEGDDDMGSAAIDARLESLRQIKPEDIDFERITSEEEDYVSAPPTYQITAYPADFTLEVLYSKWEKKDPKDREIKIPEFQRQFVWKQNQASKLIESFLCGLPVPPVFLYTEQASQKSLVIDGQQRLRSVFYFFEGFFGEEKKGKRGVFTLTGLSDKSPYKGKTYADLSQPDALRLRNCVLRSFIVQQLDPNDDTSIYHVFERLNTGGTFLANQEIRNCVHHGSFNALLHDLNKFHAWRTVLGRPLPDSRQRDVELLLRFFALLDVAPYSRPMKDFLTTFMAKNREASAEVTAGSRTLFQNTCTAVARELGERPFHLHSGLNVAMFDCVMAAFAHHLDSIPPDIKQRYGRLKANDKAVIPANIVSTYPNLKLMENGFISLVSRSTADTDVVKARFAIARYALFDHIP